MYNHIEWCIAIYLNSDEQMRTGFLKQVFLLILCLTIRTEKTNSRQSWFVFFFVSTCCPKYALHDFWWAGKPSMIWLQNEAFPHLSMPAFFSNKNNFLVFVKVYVIKTTLNTYKLPMLNLKNLTLKFNFNINISSLS